MLVNTFPSAIVLFTVVLLVAGVVVGLAVGNLPVADPMTGSAHAAPLNEQSDLDQSFDRLRKYIELSALEAKYKQEQALAVERQHYELEQMGARNQLTGILLQAVAATVSLGVVIISGGMAYYLVCAGNSKLRAVPVTPGNWQDASERAELVKQAREAERLWRQASQPVANGNGHKREGISQSA